MFIISDFIDSLSGCNIFDTAVRMDGWTEQRQYYIGLHIIEYVYKKKETLVYSV